MCSDISLWFLICIFPRSRWYWSSFHVYLLQWNVFISFAYFLNWVICFLFSEFWMFFIYSRYKFSIRYVFHRFSPILVKGKSPMFSSSTSIFLCFTFMLHFDLIFLYGTKCGVILIVLHGDICFRTICWKDCPFSIELFEPLLKISWPHMCGSIWGFMIHSIDLCVHPFTNTILS